MPFPSPRDLPGTGMELASPALAGKFFTTEPPGKSIKKTIKIPLKTQEIEKKIRASLVKIM